MTTADDYHLIDPPGSKSFREMSSAEAADYFAWHLSSMDSRISMLEGLVWKERPELEWRADFSEGSLTPLGTWWGTSVETRPRTDEDRELLFSAGPARLAIVDTRDWELTERTFSIAVDVGMYIAKVLLCDNPNFSWRLEKGNRRGISYNQPVLVGTGYSPFNPSHFAVVGAYAIASGEDGAARITRIFSTWRANLRS